MGLSRKNEVTVTETGEGNFTQSVQMGKHILIAAEPQSIGENDKRPNPYDLLLASLGACTSITLRMYALHKNIPLKSIRIILDHKKVDEEDLIHCVINLEGDLTSQQKKDFLRIAGRCPIRKTLSHACTVMTTLG